ncbi:ThiF family adenylyltransferase [Vagococcus carniphilus]|uniref:THIF-type NAD/FAD binding fold domain-containing protein n=1 Tax=Vagococcus carniphilus TaxID=218144 RepID=A0A430B6L0_9ENTE|nr:ThiF family adenylyltransferase [Vagococcus carniphilus]QNN72848.1 ThiF family adenylyltransferase [Vagococcus carniphilus]RSU15955.1 hypothetical protein CBF28_05870 [Vagococcus carniphilus]
MWLEENNKRFIEEYDLLNDLERKNDWIKNTNWNIENEELLVYYFDIDIDDKLYSLKMIFPRFFPNSPITVKINEKEVSWTSHQYTNGVLCLEWGPDNWSDVVYGVDMVKSVYALLDAERPKSTGTNKKIVPSRDNFSLGQQMRFKKRIQYLTKEMVELFLTVNSNLVLNFKENFVDTSSAVYQLSGLYIKDEEIKLLPDEQFNLLSGYRDIPGFLQKVTELKSTYDYEDFLEELDIEEIKEYMIKALQKNSLDKIIVLLSNSQVILPYYIDLIDKKVYDIFLLKDNDCEERNPYVGKISKETKIAVVGVGSLGSKISISLARSGIKNLLLVDDDVFLSHNIQRHELDIRHLGQMKVDALSKRLKKINTDIFVQTSCLALSTLESNQAYNNLINLISGCDIIVDATANDEAFYVLANISIMSNRPMVWGKVFAGGLGGVIAKNNPENNTTPFQIQEGIKNFYIDNPHEANQITQNYTQFIGDEVFIASDADVSIITSWMTKIIFSILEPNNKSIQFLSDIYFIGGKQEWIFKQPMQVISLNVEKNEIVEKVKTDISDKEKIRINKIITQIRGEKDAKNNNTK